MNIDFLKKLSNADGIASNEQEVRDVLVEELKDYADEITCDNLGSIIFKKGNKGPKIMLCAHMDEVGFIVRSVSDMGQVMLMHVGGVKPLAQFMQKVRITTEDGKKINGIIQASYDNGSATKVYVDLGAQTAQEVYDLGIQVGDMVTYTTEFEQFDLPNTVAGKAFDDRLGCYIMGEVLKRLQDIDHPNTVYMVGTSSEEVGIRGAKTAVYKVNPDVVFPIDVACFNDEFVRNHTNQRQIGKGMMLTNFDRTLAPNRTLIRYIKDTANTLHKPLQLDMFNAGGTDGGEAHKSRDGKPTAVSCLPVRYGHCAYSIANLQDIEDAIEIFTEIIKNFDEEAYRKSIDFVKGV
ncbi:aminopeptidase [Erysipelotrichaceae bacterium HCN-30851]